MKLRWVFAFLFLAIDLFLIGLMHFADTISIVHPWNTIHSPLVQYAESLFIEYIPSHGGGWKALLSTIFFYVINVVYFTLIGFFLGFIIEKLTSIFKKA